MPTLPGTRRSPVPRRLRSASPVTATRCPGPSKLGCPARSQQMCIRRAMRSLLVTSQSLSLRCGRSTRKAALSNTGGVGVTCEGTTSGFKPACLRAKGSSTCQRSRHSGRISWSCHGPHLTSCLMGTSRRATSLLPTAGSSASSIAVASVRPIQLWISSPDGTSSTTLHEPSSGVGWRSTTWSGSAARRGPLSSPWEPSGTTRRRILRWLRWADGR